MSYLLIAYVLMIVFIYINFRKSRILNLSWDVEQKLKIPMTICEVTNVVVLNISKDLKQKLMFFMVCGRGRGQDAKGDM